MAGYTSRVLFKFSLSFVVLTIIYFLRKLRDVSSKDITANIGTESKSQKISTCVPMNLVKSKESSIDQAVEKTDTDVDNSSKMHLKDLPTSSQNSDNSSKMHLKDLPTSSQNSDMHHSQINGNSYKSSENGDTCDILAQSQEKVINGTSVTCDKVSDCDISLKLPDVVKVNGNDVSINDVETELVTGVENLTMEINGHTNGHNGVKLKDSIDIDDDEEDTGEGNLCLNGSLEESDTETLKNVIVENNNDSGVMSKELPTTELTCETNFVPTFSTPDSGLSTELQESDAASSSMSEPSDFNGANGDMLKSPGASVDSNDTGKDCCENFENPLIAELVQAPYIEVEEVRKMYEFEIPQELCGLLIGKNGRHVQYIKEETNADILIRRHPFFAHVKSCAVSGTEDEINTALSFIRERFPQDKFPNLTLTPLNHLQHECALPATVKLPLPEGVTFDVILSTVVTPGHFFVHQPTHPTYYTLSCLSNEMSELYSREDAPNLCRVSPGHIVAAPIGAGWYRAEVLHIYDDSESALIKLLDFGGFVTVPLIQLRQMKVEYSCIPFQAAECFLGNVTYPEGEEGWSDEAKSLLEDLARGQILQGYIVGYGECSIPYVHLFKVLGATTIFINRELVNRGLARWIEHPQQT